ncbi:hypothetical protein NKH02_34260, partial [Mesorhizobium sp. M1396]
VEAVRVSKERVERLEGVIEEFVPTWSLARHHAEGRLIVPPTIAACRRARGPSRASRCAMARGP